MAEFILAFVCCAAQDVLQDEVRSLPKLTAAATAVAARQKHPAHPPSACDVWRSRKCALSTPLIDWAVLRLPMVSRGVRARVSIETHGVRRIAATLAFISALESQPPRVLGVSAGIRFPFDAYTAGCARAWLETRERSDETVNERALPLHVRNVLAERAVQTLPQRDPVEVWVESLRRRVLSAAVATTSSVCRRRGCATPCTSCKRRNDEAAYDSCLAQLLVARAHTTWRVDFPTTCFVADVLGAASCARPRNKRIPHAEKPCTCFCSAECVFAVGKEVEAMLGGEHSLTLPSFAHPILDIDGGATESKGLLLAENLLARLLERNDSTHRRLETNAKQQLLTALVDDDIRQLRRMLVFLLNVEVGALATWIANVGLGKKSLLGRSSQDNPVLYSSLQSWRSRWREVAKTHARCGPTELIRSVRTNVGVFLRCCMREQA